MNGVILAAGRGSRIADITDDLPKSFLELGGKTIIDHQMEALRAAGIDKTVIVIGYRMQLFIEKYANDPNITLVKNPFFEYCVNGTSYGGSAYTKSSGLSGTCSTSSCVNRHAANASR